MGVRATEIRRGHVLEKDGDLLLVTDFEHRTPGKGQAIISLKTRSLNNGQTGAIRLASGDIMDIAFLEKKKAEYLFKESNGNFVFMDTETYDQLPLSADLVGEKMGFVRENSTVELTYHGSTAIGIELPSSVVLRVTEAEAAVKGNTATNVKKDAVLETGLHIRVPLHITAGEEIKVRTDTGEFISRAN